MGFTISGVDANVIRIVDAGTTISNLTVTGGTSAGTIGVSTAGSEYLRLTSGDTIGIGITSPDNYIYTGAPAITFTGGSDTGWFYNGDRLRFSVGVEEEWECDDDYYEWGE